MVAGVIPDPEPAAEQAIRHARDRLLFARPVHLDEVDSTNRYLADLALAGAPEGEAVVARRQSAGRGRLGRKWLDVPGGSLLCSMLFRPQLERRRWHLVGWAVALGARDAISDVTGVETAFKWPNDLLAGERKVAGVLGEVVPPSGLVLGIGVNCNWPPDWPPAELAATATALGRESGSLVDLEALERALLGRVAVRYESLASGGEAALASEYRSRLATIGRLVSVELPTETVVGRALDVDDGGCLLVDVGACVRSVEAGDVVHVRSPGGLGAAG